MNIPSQSRLLLVALLLSCGVMFATGHAQDDPPSLEFAGQLGADPFGEREPEVTLSANFELVEGTRTGRIHVTAEVREDQHIYSVNQKKGGPTKSTITVVAGQGVELTGPFRTDSAPKIKFYPEFYPDLQIEEHEGTVTWTAPIQLEESLETDSLLISVEYDGLACTNQEDGAGACIPQFHTAEAGFKGYFVNDAPLLDNTGGIDFTTISGSLDLKNNGDLVSGLVASSIGDVDTGAATGIAVSGLVSGNGSWQFSTDSGTTWTAVGSVSDTSALLLGDTDRLRFVPDGLNADSGSVTYRAWDQTSGTAGTTVDASSNGGTTAFSTATDTASITVTGVNDGSQNSSQGVAFDPDKVTVKNDSQNRSLGLVLLAAFAAGFILNFMPCVLPVVGLKIMTFVEQAGESRQRIFMLNLWFSLGMLAVFLILATLARVISLGWGAQFSSLAFNIVLVAVVFVFALSFLGIWEIPIPGFSVSTGMNTEGEGAVGAFAKGMFTTVLATPCSGPLLFPALTYSVSQPVLITYLGFTMVGLGMAFPYLMIGAFPQLISFLPRPGAWMETFKHIMGFVLLATVVWLMTIVATVSLPALVPLVGFLFALWGACWWYGKVPLTAGRAARGMALLQGGIFSALIGWVMFSEMALGGVMESRFKQLVDREVATRISDLDEPTGPVDPTGELQWERYSVDRLTELTAQQKTVFVDFTADW